MPAKTRKRRTSAESRARREPLPLGLLVFATERWFGGASTACREPHAVAYVSVCDGQTKGRTYSFVLKYAGLVASFQQ